MHKNLQMMLTTVAAIAATTEYRHAVAKQTSADAAAALAAAYAVPTTEQLNAALQALDHLEQQKVNLNKALVRVELELYALNKVIDVIGEAATTSIALVYLRLPNN